MIRGSTGGVRLNEITLYTSTNKVPHDRFFNFVREPLMGKPLPSWSSNPGPVLLRKIVRTGKNDELVQKVQLIEANLTYTRVKLSGGRESNVSL